MGYVAHLAFHHASDGEHQLADLRIGELREEVSLVLHRVFGGGEEGNVGCVIV